MRSFIGVLLILFSVYSLIRPQLPAVSGDQAADGDVGLLSGFFGGSTGLAGLPVIVWSSLHRWSLLWFGGTGHLPADTKRLFIVGLPGVVLGTWLSFKLYGKLDERTFRIVVLVLLLISGVTLLPWQWA